MGSFLVVFFFSASETLIKEKTVPNLIPVEANVEVRKIAQTEFQAHSPVSGTPENP